MVRSILSRHSRLRRFRQMGGMTTVAILLILFWTVFTSASPLPFVVLHGILDACKNDAVCQFTEFLSAASGAKGYCIEIGNGVSDSFFMKMDEQVDIVCQKVRQISDLQNGYNLVGLSQGALIGRAVVETCDGAPRVNNLISLAGPHAGTASVPLCNLRVICMAVNAIIKYGIYSSYVQNHLGPAGYVKIPTDLEDYYRECLFLPKVNNELPDRRNATYKSRFARLNHLVLIKFERDKVIIPAETAWFGYYPPNDFTTVLSPRDTQLYTEDWIGLQALDRAGNVSFVSLCGGHLDITQSESLNHVVPYLKGPAVASVVATCSHTIADSRVFRLSPLR